MNLLIASTLLLAGRSSIFRDMGSGFREKRESFEPTDLLWWVFVAAVVIAAFGVVAGILAKQDKHRLFNSPRALFNALCKAHGLDRVSRALLKQVARAQQVTVPARLFLEPSWFEPNMLGPELQSQREAIAILRKRLFADRGAHSSPESATSG
jgi:hypothetical protein